MEAERGLVVGFRAGGVLAGHLFVLTLAVVAGLTFELTAVRWAVLLLALAAAMAAELFGQVLVTLTAAVMRHVAGSAEGDADPPMPPEVDAALRLSTAAVAVACAGAAAAVFAVFAPPVLDAFGG